MSHDGERELAALELRYPVIRERSLAEIVQDWVAHVTWHMRWNRRFARPGALLAERRLEREGIRGNCAHRAPKWLYATWQEAAFAHRARLRANGTGLTRIRSRCGYQLQSRRPMVAGPWTQERI